MRGGTLNVSIADDVDYLDPQRAALPAAFAVMRAMHRGLMAFPADPQRTDPVPDLAASAPIVSPDRRTYTFTLREDAAFGPPANRPVRAADVIAGLRRLTARGSVSPYAPYARAITALQAVDDRTVTISLARPFNDLLWVLAVPAAAAIPVELQAVARPAPAAIAPSGPYMLAATDGYVPESGIHLVRNPAWRASSDPVRGGFVDEVRITVGRDVADVRSRLETGAADLSLDTPPDVATIAATPGPRIHTAPSGCLRYLWMNTRVSPLGTVGLRKVIAAAVDRAAVRAALGAEIAGEVTSWPLVRTITGYEGGPSPSPSVPSSPRSKPRARYTIPLLVGDRASDRTEGAAVAEALSYAGVRVQVRATPISSLYVDSYEVPARRVPMGIATWCGDWPGLAGRSALAALLDGRRIPSQGNQNYSRLHAPSLERLLDAAALAAPEQAASAWAAAAAEAVALAAIVPLVDLNEVSQVSGRLGGLAASPAFPRGDLANAWVKP